MFASGDRLRGVSPVRRSRGVPGRPSGGSRGLVAVELHEVVAREDQSPLRPDCLSAAVIEPLELPVVLGVTEYGLDRLLPFGV